MVKRGSDSLTWTSYNLPSVINKGSNSSSFYYGASRARYKQVTVTATGGNLPAGTETTTYVAGLFEKVVKPSGVTEYKHYLMVNKGVIAIRTLRSNSADDLRYLHSDHLGSVDVITDTSATPQVVQRLSFDAFGKRRGASWSGGLTSTDWSNIAAITHRGFTSHEQLDNVDLVHMNGRVYDPNIGRFISADPTSQSPYQSQDLNPYSYVMNNPLSMTDPTGYSWLSKALSSIAHFIGKYWKMIVAVVLAVVTYGLLAPYLTAAFATANLAACSSILAGEMVAGAIAGAISGGIMGGWKGALVGAIGGALFAGASLIENAAVKAIASGAIGGLSSEALGGNFATGFIFAFAASAAADLYKHFVKYSDDWRPGGDAVEKRIDTEPVKGADNFGTYGNPQKLTKFWQEGNTASWAFNKVPGLNAAAGMHDMLLVKLNLQMGFWRDVVSFVSMPAAGAVSYAGLMQGIPSELLASDNH